MIIEYIWIDGTGPTPQLRSKTKVDNNNKSRLVTEAVQDGLVATDDDDNIPENLRECYLGPVWGADGSSTNQAAGKDSDIILVPVCSVRDPFRANAFLNLCEVLDSKGEPHSSNTRAKFRKVLTPRRHFQPWLGLEQEYTLLTLSNHVSLDAKGNTAFVLDPLGFVAQKGYPRPQGPYYCGVGANNIYGRGVYEEFLKATSLAGIAITGANWEVMPGQAEFQVSAPEALLTCDHLWLARWIIQRVAEDHRAVVSFDPKPADGDWNGAGMHANFSTGVMRSRDGLDVIKEACDQLEEHVQKHLDAYGEGYERRLTGDHETCSFQEYRWGIADRTASVRIPLQVKEDGKGYLEDRRPNANADPYNVGRVLVDTICRRFT